MKNIFILLGAFSTLFISCDEKKEENAFFILTNSIDVARTEVVVLDKSQVFEKLPELDEKSTLEFKDESGNLIPYQLDDLDLDGEWDELAAVVDFEAKEEKKIYVSAFAKADPPKFKKATDVHLGVGKAKPNASEVQKYSRSYDPREKDSLFFQMEGPSWENDKVGFRMYFDPRNGIDIFGKTTVEPTLHLQGLSTNYHEKADWGMDILKVGNSLGAGSIALKYQDSLYRITGWNGARFEQITEGPARAIFKMTYLDERIGDKNINIEHLITIEKGDWFYKSEVKLYGEVENMELVTGIVDLKPNALKVTQPPLSGYLMMSYGKQSENKDHLGMAIITLQDDIGTSAAPEEGDGITRTHLLNLKSGNEHTFYFLSGWEASDPIFKDSEGFIHTTEQSAIMINNPIKVQ